MTERRVHLSPRLSCALELLRGNGTVADIGCDHGRLTAALLQQKVCETVIATDISGDSLQKAKDLIHCIGLADRVSFRVGDGLSVLDPFACDAIALLGMGGTLMARILEKADPPLRGAKAVVMQPMRAQADIRAYLYQNGYWITDDCIVAEGERLYQVFRAVPAGQKQVLPQGWPDDCFELGFVAWQQHDPLFFQLLEQQLARHMSRLGGAEGTEGEVRIRKKILALQSILTLTKERDRHEHS